MTAPEPRVTVAVPTYRRSSLTRTLTGLAAQQPGFDFEVVVVDNDPERSAESTVRAHTGSIAADVRYVTEQRSGASYARNAAIAAARAPVIAWCDDDVLPQPGWLEALVAPILSGRAEGTGGRVILDPDVPRPRWFDEVGIGGYITHFHLADEEYELGPREFVVTANAAYATDWLRRVGGFDPALGAMATINFGGEDIKLSRAVTAAGGRIRYVPSAVVVHELPPERLSSRYLLRRAWWVGRSDWVVDEEELRRRRLGGARLALDWYGRELGRRRAEGILHSRVLFHALCDTARVAGSLVGAAHLVRDVRRERAKPAGTVGR